MTSDTRETFRKRKYESIKHCLELMREKYQEYSKEQFEIVENSLRAYTDEEM